MKTPKTAGTIKAHHLHLESDSTIRLSPRSGDFLLLIRCTNFLSDPPQFDVFDFWEFREGDNLLITNREEDYPAPVQQMEEGGNSLWKLLVGDRLAWVGWRSCEEKPEPKLIRLVSCFCDGYAYGEPAHPTLELVLTFGAPTSRPSEATRNLWMLGYDAAVGLGVPRSIGVLE